MRVVYLGGWVRGKEEGAVRTPGDERWGVCLLEG